MPVAQDDSRLSWSKTEKTNPQVLSIYTICYFPPLFFYFIFLVLTSPFIIRDVLVYTQRILFVCFFILPSHQKKKKRRFEYRKLTNNNKKKIVCTSRVTQWKRKTTVFLSPVLFLGFIVSIFFFPLPKVRSFCCARSSSNSPPTWTETWSILGGWLHSRFPLFFFLQSRW